MIPDRHPVQLVGSRIRLREVSRADASVAFAWASDPAFFRYLAHEPAVDQEAEAAFLDSLVARAAERPRTQYDMGIEWRATTELVGTARLGITSTRDLVGDLGYGVRPSRHGEGIATEAASLLLDFGFRELGLHRIFAYHHPDNVGSRRVLEKLGMQYEGRLRENMRAHGAWRDSCAWAILDREWAPHGDDARADSDS